MYVSDNTLIKIKQNVDCRNLIKSHGIYLNNCNISCSNLNPNHTDKNPSMAVYNDHALCFGCGFNADAIKITQILKNMNFVEAVEHICSNHNIPIEYERGKFNNENKKDILQKIWSEIKDVIMTDEFMEYMNKRKIDYRIAINYGCRDIFLVRSKIINIIKAYPENELKISGLLNDKNEIWKPLSELMKGNHKYKGFIIPIFNEKMEIQSFRYRLYNNIKFKYEKDGKYIEKVIKVYAQSKSNSFIMGLHKLVPEKNKTLYVCEGEPDYFSLKSYLKDKNIDGDVIGLCVIIKEFPKNYIDILKKYKDIKILLHNTEKAIKLSENIQKSVITSCNNINDVNYWKKNIYDCFFDEKNDINDQLVRGEFDISILNFVQKIYAENETSNDSLKNNDFFNHSSLNLDNTWIYEKPTREKSLLNSNNNELVIPQGDVGLLVAAGGTGKTQLLMQLVVALSTRKKWLNYFQRDNESNGKILYIFGEENIDRIKRRFLKIFDDMELSNHERELFSKEVVFLSLHKVAATFNYNDNSFQNKLKAFLNKNSCEHGHGWSLIIFDPASRFLPKDAEIDNAAATAFIRECERFTDLTGNPTVLISHHVNKSSINGAKIFSEENDSTQSASRGASGLVDGARFVINIDTIFKEDWLKNTNFYNNKLLKIKHSKINCGPVMKSINLAVDENGQIFPLSESEEEELKTEKARYNSSSKPFSKNLAYI